MPSFSAPLTTSRLHRGRTDRECAALIRVEGPGANATRTRRERLLFPRFHPTAMIVCCIVQPLAYLGPRIHHVDTRENDRLAFGIVVGQKNAVRGAMSFE